MYGWKWLIPENDWHTFRAPEGTKEVEKELDEYFDKTSKEQFLKDLESSGCSHMVEEIEVTK